MQDKLQHPCWFDLTVENAEQVKDFYSEVVGWTAQPVDMDGYQDYNMLDQEGNVVNGICHAKGSNTELPPSWMTYISVDKITQRVDKVVASGGKTLTDVKHYSGYGSWCVIQDPAGAVFALFEKENN